MKISIFRKAHFNAAHRLYNQKWSDEKNLEIFGKCSYPNFHGHNYELEVKLTGKINPETGYLMNLKDLKDIIEEQIEEKFDHKNLNIDVPEFENTIPSTENFAVLIYDILRRHIDKKIELQVRLYETPRNFVEYPAN
jgi:6-pyruvoyltetrahydropterin/6-carboxytetrahydropterin synthase